VGSQIQHLIAQCGRMSKLGSSMSAAEKWIREGHPSMEELVADQHAVFPRDWEPEKRSICSLQMTESHARST
jgi:hypothetical protein